MGGFTGSCHEGCFRQDGRLLRTGHGQLGRVVLHIWGDPRKRGWESRGRAGTRKTQPSAPAGGIRRELRGLWAFGPTTHQSHVSERGSGGAPRARVYKRSPLFAARGICSGRARASARLAPSHGPEGPNGAGGRNRSRSRRTPCRCSQAQTLIMWPLSWPERGSTQQRRSCLRPSLGVLVDPSCSRLVPSPRAPTHGGPLRLVGPRVNRPSKRHSPLLRDPLRGKHGCIDRCRALIRLLVAAVAHDAPSRCSWHFR